MSAAEVLRQPQACWPMPSSRPNRQSHATAAPRRISGSAPVAGSMRGGEQGHAAGGVYRLLARDGWNLPLRSDAW